MFTNTKKWKSALDGTNRKWLVNVILIALPIFLFFVSFMIGRYPLSPVEVIMAILAKFFPFIHVSAAASTVVWDIRLPRIMAALLVGAALSVAGASFQGTFKNPLVSPDILGCFCRSRVWSGHSNTTNWNTHLYPDLGIHLGNGGSDPHLRYCPFH